MLGLILKSLITSGVCECHTEKAIFSRNKKADPAHFKGFIKEREVCVVFFLLLLLYLRKATEKQPVSPNYLSHRAQSAQSRLWFTEPDDLKFFRGSQVSPLGLKLLCGSVDIWHWLNAAWTEIAFYFLVCQAVETVFLSDKKHLKQIATLHIWKLLITNQTHTCRHGLTTWCSSSYSHLEPIEVLYAAHNKKPTVQLS